MDYTPVETSSKPPLKLNVRGLILNIRIKVMWQFPDSVFEAIISGRQTLEMVDGLPFFDRDPLVFQKALAILNSYPYES